MSPHLSRREMLTLGGSVAAALATSARGEAAPTGKTFRVGVISAAILGKPQTRNGHTWHFAQYLHPNFDLNALTKYNPNAVPVYRDYLRNPKFTFDQLPFPDTKITHYYDADPSTA